MKIQAAAAAAIAFVGLAPFPAVASECDDLRGQFANFWRVKKGETSPGFDLTPMALASRNATTTMPQLALVCRKDQAGGDVTIMGDNAPYNATLASNECRLVFLLGIKTITAQASDGLDGDEACGSFEIIK